MKVCFIGLGSIAARHIRNVKELVGKNLEIDVLRSGKSKRRNSPVDDLLHKVYYHAGDLPVDYDVIFITNPTAVHYETLSRVKNHARHFFIEKPVFKTGGEDIEALGLDRQKTYYVACPLRYTNVIQYLKKNIPLDEVYSVRCISSSYLPDWRPGADYRDTYSAKKELGGGVSIDLIHEWDYLCYLFGTPEKVLSLMGKKSPLEIDSEDIAVYIAQYGKRFVELHLDYFGRVPQRKIELYCREDTIEADLIEQKILFKRKNLTVDLYEERDSYHKKELLHFLDIIRGNCINDNTLEQACQTLRITGGIGY